MCCFAKGNFHFKTSHLSKEAVHLKPLHTMLIACDIDTRDFNMFSYLRITIILNERVLYRREITIHAPPSNSIMLSFLKDNSHFKARNAT